MEVGRVGSTQKNVLMHTEKNASRRDAYFPTHTYTLTHNERHLRVKKHQVPWKHISQCDNLIEFHTVNPRGSG